MERQNPYAFSDGFAIGFAIATAFSLLIAWAVF